MTEDDLEITDAMRVAGAAVVRRIDRRFEDEEGIAEDVYIAMTNALNAPLEDQQQRLPE